MKMLFAMKINTLVPMNVLDQESHAKAHDLAGPLSMAKVAKKC